MGVKKPPCRIQRCKRRPLRAGLCGTHLLRKADEAFSRYIRERDGRCRMCGVVMNHSLQCCHIISRRYRRIRFDPRNAVTGCPKCHYYYETRIAEWVAWVDDEFGEGTWEGLRQEALPTDFDWKDLAEPWADGDR